MAVAVPDNDNAILSLLFFRMILAHGDNERDLTCPFSESVGDTPWESD